MIFYIFVYQLFNYFSRRSQEKSMKDLLDGKVKLGGL